MFRSFLKPLGIAALLSLSFGSAHAVTLSADETICEGPEALLVGLLDCDGTNSFGDAPSSGSTVDVELLFSNAGSATILGGVRGRDDDEFADTFTLTGNGAYNLTLELLGTFADRRPYATTFDATWTQGGLEIGELEEPGVIILTTSINLGAGGSSLFSLDAAGGDYANNSIGQYKLTVTAVPLPAGGLLILSGLAGFAALKRRKKA